MIEILFSGVISGIEIPDTTGTGGCGCCWCQPNVGGAGDLTKSLPA